MVGAGAIGGVVGAHLARDGHPVLLVDADPQHVAAINTDGLVIEGPVEQFTVRVPAVTPERLPDQLGTVLLAVKAHHTDAALDLIAPRLDPDGVVVSLQNGINEPRIGERVGAAAGGGGAGQLRRRRGRPGSDRPGRPRCAAGGRAGRTARARGSISWWPTSRGPSRRPTCSGCLWAKEAYGAMLFATAVSDLAIADALADPAYRELFLALGREVLDAAPVEVEAFDGFDPGDLEGSIEHMVEFNRRSAKTHSGVYRDLAVRHRPTEVGALVDAVPGPLVGRVAELIHAIEDGRRTCERANLDLLAAYQRLQRLGPPLNAVITVVDAPDRGPTGPLHGARRGHQGQHRHARAGDDLRVGGRRAAARPGRRSDRGSGCGRRVPTCSARPTCWSTRPAASRRPTA